jgi:hypothetical protein
MYICMNKYHRMLIDPKLTLEDKKHVMRMIYGGQQHATDFHRVIRSSVFQCFMI